MDEKGDDFLSHMFWIVVFAILGGVLVSVLFELAYLSVVYDPLTVFRLIIVFLLSIPELQILLGVLIGIVILSILIRKYAKH